MKNTSEYKRIVLKLQVGDKHKLGVLESMCTSLRLNIQLTKLYSNL